MFSVFYENSLASSIGLTDAELAHKLKVNLGRIGQLLADAKRDIGAIGFPSMHCNLIIANLQDVENFNTGLKQGGVGGTAFRSRRYMKIDYESLMYFSEGTKKIIVHEWAHLWMFGHSKEFNETVTKLYNEVLKTIPSKVKHEEVFKREFLRIRAYTTYTINSMAKIPDIMRLMNGMDYDEDEAKNKISNRIMEVIVKSLTSLKIKDDKIHSIHDDLLVDSDNIAYVFFDSIVDNLSDDSDQAYSILEQDIENNNFAKLACAGMQTNVIEIILNKIKELYLKFSSKRVVPKSKLETLLQGKAGMHFKEFLNKMVNWNNAYGLSSPDELWATAIDDFFKLPMTHRRIIINLMNPVKTISDKQRAFLNQ